MDAGKDVTQGVFLALAQNASRLTNHPVLSGWLHTTTRNIAANFVRTNARRQAREREAVVMNELLSGQTEASWEDISPHLDAALGELCESDRNAVLLRYFEKKTAQEMAGILGVSAAAAQKRVNRAVERLREVFIRSGVAVGTGGVAVVISANAVQAAPVGFASAITAAAIAGSTTTTAVTSAVIKTVAMTTLQKTVVTLSIALLAGAGIYELRQSANLRHQLQELRSQQALLPDRMQQLIRERDDATNRLAVLLADNARLKSNPYRRDALKLRDENEQLRTNAAQANDPFVKQALGWKENERKLRKLFAEHPEQRVPELALLSDEQWLGIAQSAHLDSEIGIRKAASQVRHSAKNNFMPDLMTALSEFVKSNGGILPTDLNQLQPFFKQPVDEAMLQQYELTATGKYKGGFVVKDKAVVDKEYDYWWQVGPNGYGPDASERILAGIKAQVEILKPVVEAYAAANNNAQPNAMSDLKPFITTPQQQTAINELIEKGFTTEAGK
ncbi:MAG: hypothetical protein JWO95_1720 [Verrucomicrobiales bacterium]|nr:hypothetical protein [Verrucomicrobiales bacterium]